MKYSITLKVSNNYGTHVVVELFAGYIPAPMSHSDASRHHNGTFTMPIDDFIGFVKRLRPHLLYMSAIPEGIADLYIPTNKGYHTLKKGA